jgi:hypothetical protein
VERSARQRLEPTGRRTAREFTVIRKLSSGQYRLYSRKKNPRTGRRRNLGTFKSRAAAEKHERAVQYFKAH